MHGKGTSDGVEYFDIILGFGYIDIKPTIGTTCLIGIIDGQEVVTFLINAEQVDLVEIKSEKLQFNDGLNLGLVKIKELTGRLNNIEKTINSHLNEYRIHNHSHPQGATTGFITPPITPDVAETDLDDIEDKTITH